MNEIIRSAELDLWVRHDDGEDGDIEFAIGARSERAQLHVVARMPSSPTPAEIENAVALLKAALGSPDKNIILTFGQNIPHRTISSVLGALSTAGIKPKAFFIQQHSR